MSLFKAPVNGLYTSPNPFDNTPPGSVSQADNVVFEAPGILSPRRGYDYVPNSSFGALTDRCQAMAHHGNLIVFNYGGDRLGIYSINSEDNTDYGPGYSPVSPTTGRMKFSETQNNLYFNTSTGIKLVAGDTVDPSVLPAGNPAGLLSVPSFGSMTNAWMPYDSAVAYRYELCTKDAFGRVLTGAPSSRAVIRNDFVTPIGYLTRQSTFTACYSQNGQPHNLQVGDTFTLTGDEPNFPSGTFTVTFIIHAAGFLYISSGNNAASTIEHGVSVSRTIDVKCQLPSTATTSHFLKLYRSETTDFATNEPSDNIRQVYETARLSTTDLENGYIIINDICPDAMAGSPIDTSPDFGVGISQASYNPPISTDLAYWNDRMWYSNCTSKQQLEIQIIGVGISGLNTGDTITIDGHVFTGVSPADINVGWDYFDLGAFEFGIVKYFDVAFNIEQTAMSLCYAINKQSVSYYAFYVSGQNDNPGMILLQERSIGGSGFPVLSSNGAMWAPQLSVSVPVSSVAERQPAYLFYSKLQIPEAVPLVNYLPIAETNKAILRIVAYNNKLYVFKENGIWCVSQNYPYQVQQISTASLVGIDSVAIMGERIYALTNQGIVTISDAGVVVISLPIEADIMSMMGSGLSNLKTMSFGLGYESDRKYILWMPTDANSTENTQAFVYSQLANGFTRYSFGVSSAAIKPDTDVLYVGATSDGTEDTQFNLLLKERKTRTSYDFADKIWTRYVLSITDKTIVLNSVANLKVGDLITDDNGVLILITDVDDSTNTITTLTAGTFVPYPTRESGNEIHQSFESIIKFNPITGNDPAVMKNFSQCSFLFSKTEPYQISSLFSNEIVQSDSGAVLEFNKYGFGRFSEAPYGSPTERIRRVAPIDTDKANCTQLSVGLRVQEACKNWRFLGYGVEYLADTEKNRG